MKLVELLKKYKGDNKVFVETGTYNGAGVQAALDAGFEDIYSFEIDEKLAGEARKRFYGDKRVKIFVSSSALIGFESIVSEIKEPILFWLDAHKMGGGGIIGDDYPLINEIHAIGRAGHQCTVLIDDVRLFPRYRVTIDGIKEVLGERYNVAFETIREQYPNDVMCIKRSGIK